MNIGLIQYSPTWENKEESKEKITQLVRGINSTVSLLVFPELTLTGFTMRSKRFAEGVEGDSVNFFSSLALNCNSHILAGFIEEDKGQYFNTLIHLGNSGKLITRYRKIHPFSYTGENRHYTAGERPVITTIEGIKFVVDLYN